MSEVPVILRFPMPRCWREGEKCGLGRGFEVATSWLPNLGIETMLEQRSEVAAEKRRSVLCGSFSYQGFNLPAMLLCLLGSPA